MDKEKQMIIENESPEGKKKGFFSCEKVSSMFERGRRDWSVDILRCLSCFTVCAVHATNFSYNYGFGGTGADGWLHHEVYRMLFASPTVLFVMISGIFFLSPERNVTAPKIWKKNVIKMAAAYALWSFIYAIYRIHMMDPQPEITARFFFDQWLIQPDHLWYVPMIIGLYIICPILRPITASYDTKLFRYIVFIFIMGLILWTIVDLPAFRPEESHVRIIVNKTPMGLICQYPIWMMIGWIAYTYRPVGGFRVFIYGLGVITIIVGMVINNTLGINPDAYDGFSAITQKFSIFVFFKNIAIFYFIVNVFRNCEFSPGFKRFLRNLSDCTLLIYLVHYLILYILHDLGFPYSLGVSPWLGVWINAVISFVVGAVFATLCHVVFNILRGKPVTSKKRSRRIYEKIEKEKEKG